MVTTRTIQEVRAEHGVPVQFVPASLYAYTLGQNLLARLIA